MCVLSYKYKESMHFDCCVVKHVQRITVLKVYECIGPLTPRVELRFGLLYSDGKCVNYEKKMKPEGM